MVADTAVKLALNAEAEFDLVVTRPSKYSTSEFPELAWPFLQEMELDQNAQSGSDTTQQLESTFWPTYTGLRLYLDRHKVPEPSGRIPVVDESDLRNLHKRTREAVDFAQVIRISMVANKPPHLDMINSEVNRMFKQNKLRVGTVFAVQIHLDILDLLGDKARQSWFDLTVHLNQLIGKLNLAGERESPFNSDSIRQDAYHEFSGFHGAIGYAEEWVNKDGYEKQWQILARNPKVASHPVLRIMIKEKNYFLLRQPVLCGMIKYDLYLRYHAAGLRHEYQSLAICTMAHIYVAGRLQDKNANDRVWPDMEFAIYAQDPNWLFVGGLPQTPEDAQKKFLLAAGSSAINSARNIDIRKLRVNVNKLRDFQETCMFGQDVFLPHGPFQERSEKSMTKRLFEVMSGSDIGSCARIASLYMSAHQSSTNSTTLSGKTHSLDAAAILANFANWLDADMPALYFDWYLLTFACEGVWKLIKQVFVRWPEWDQTSMSGNKPAYKPAIGILTPDKNFPFFLNIAYAIMQQFVRHEDDDGEPRGAVCLQSMAKYHKQAAKIFFQPGPLHAETLHRNWPDEDWRPKWRGFQPKPGENLQEASVREIFMEYGMKSMLANMFGAR